MSHPLEQNVSDLSQIRQAVLSFDLSALYMPPVYKFVKEEYMDSFFDSGDLRIGTLHNFRKVEQYGLNRGDPFEGKNTVVQYVEEHRGPTVDTFIGQIMNLGPGATIKNSWLVQHRDWPEAYVFCSSKSFSEKLFLEWHAKEGTTACYEIFNPLGFAFAVNKVLKDRAYFTGLDEIKYIDGHINGAGNDFRILSPFIKQLKYLWQDEFRWVWTHRNPAIDVAAKNWKVPDARQFCRKVARLEGGKIKYLWQDDVAKS